MQDSRGIGTARIDPNLPSLTVQLTLWKWERWLIDAWTLLNYNINPVDLVRSTGTDNSEDIDEAVSSSLILHHHANQRRLHLLRCFYYEIMLDNSQNVLITGGRFTQVEQHGTPGFTQLRAAIADGAMHDSGERFDPPKCYPGTREVILKKLLDWIIAHVPGDAFIHWVQGTAGGGKSAILQEIAEMCAKQKRLIASFFFSRTATLRNNEKRLVATIAYQLAQSIPATRPYIEKAIENDPAILAKSLDSQLLELVIAPLDQAYSTAGEGRANWPRLILLDGLDECGKGQLSSAF
ncbi:hypothetical protein NLJ89_g5881 [Agrocybe chaxingu]|uniref:Nephrocystin 3-like N-terminal domain-containing protein n=1 Tax=Agrocybe chaxingu TaxID=84603 RepID=A0A9W8K1P6_9AGAR|nr:hypothetical protein NLJ89_g5881 [Agrocybe chaxingu]